MSLAIVLSVLKIIGVSILVILGVFLGILLFLLILLFILLLVPIRYQTRLIYDEKGLQFYFRFHYLLRLLSGEVRKEEKLFYRVRIGFFTLFSSLKKPKKKAKKSKKKELKTVEEKIDNKELRETTKGATIIKEEKEKKAEISEKEGKEEPKKETVTEEEEKDFEDKIEAFFQKFEALRIRVFDKIKGFFSIFQDLSQKKDALIDFYYSDGTVETVKLLTSQSYLFIRTILPKKISGRLRFGTGDVYTEGQYLTYLCLFYGLYADKLEIEPEWEEKVFEADVTMKGKIRLFTILRICIKVYFNEDFKKFRDNIDLVKTRLEHS